MGVVILPAVVSRLAILEQYNFILSIVPIDTDIQQITKKLVVLIYLGQQTFQAFDNAPFPPSTRDDETSPYSSP